MQSVAKLASVNILTYLFFTRIECHYYLRAGGNNIALSKTKAYCCTTALKLVGGVLRERVYCVPVVRSCCVRYDVRVTPSQRRNKNFLRGGLGKRILRSMVQYPVQVHRIVGFIELFSLRVTQPLPDNALSVVAGAVGAGPVPAALRPAELAVPTPVGPALAAVAASRGPRAPAGLQAHGGAGAAEPQVRGGIQVRPGRGAQRHTVHPPASQGELLQGSLQRKVLERGTFFYLPSFNVVNLTY